MIVFVLIAVAVGAGTALSPCALPVLPALLSATAASGRARPLGVVLGLSATFLLTIAFTATVLRHVGLGGSELRWAGIVVLAIAGVAAVVPAVGHRLDRPLAGLSRLGPKRMGDGFGSGLLVGAALGFVYAPCAGPVLAAVIAASAATGRTVAIAAGYTLGTAAVLFAIALGGRRVLAPLRRAGALRVQQALGAVLLATAVLLAVGLDTRFETALARHTSDITVTGRPRAVARGAGSAAGPPRQRPLRGDARVVRAPGAGGGARLHRHAALVQHAGRQAADASRRCAAASCSSTSGPTRASTASARCPTCEAWDARYRARGPDDRRRPHPRVRLRARRRQRRARDRRERHPLSRRAGQRPRHLERLRQPVLARRVPDRRAGPGPPRVGRRGRVRRHGERDPRAARRARRGGRLVGGQAARHHPGVATRRRPETYLGTERAQGFVGTPPADGTRTYTPPAQVPLSRFALGGTWTIGPQAATAGAGATIDATVRARFVYLVLSPPKGHAGAVTVIRDGAGPRRVTVTSQRLYRLVALGKDGEHRVHLALAPGTSAYAFTFG